MSASTGSIIAGIVLPESVLTTPWFGAFALFVGFNTVIYLGLTLAKFIPWPSPMHPDHVRALLPAAHPEVDTMPRHLPSETAATDDAAESLRRRNASQTIPLALALTGIVGIIVGLVNTLLYLSTLGPIVLFSAGYGLLFVVIAQVLARRSVSAPAMWWTWTVLMVLLIVETCWRAALQDSAVVLAYAVIALVVLAPISLSWTAGAVGAALGLAPIVLAGVDVTRVNTLSWAIAACTGALAGFVLLQLRLSAVKRVAAEQARAQVLASTDQLTGTFSRTGILALAPSVAQAAEHAGGEVGVVICRVADMGTTSADYGFAYGGDVLVATARALKESLPAGTLIGRWGGETFLALLGEPAPDPAVLHGEVEAALAASGVALGKRPVAVNVGCATGRPGTTTLEDLVAQANAGANA